jgi:hypothetical protein
VSHSQYGLPLLDGCGVTSRNGFLRTGSRIIWVLELKNGSVRNLPLSAVAKIHVPRAKKEAQRPREDVLQLMDGSTTLQAKSLDDLASQLRQRYPEGEYGRTLHTGSEIARPSSDGQMA